jgi:hypothetical protein
MQIAFADIRFLKESGHKTEALCFSFGRHLAQQAPGQPSRVRFLERGRLFAERRSYSNVCVFNRPQSADRATFKCSRNLFPANRLSHSVSPVLDQVGLGAAWKGANLGYLSLETRRRGGEARLLGFHPLLFCRDLIF